MEILKPCSICRKNIANYSCRLCGAYVCDSCYNKQRRLCIGCYRGKVI